MQFDDSSHKFNFISNEQRRRAQRQNLRMAVNRAYGNLPIYTIEDIIEHKMPFYDARLINLRSNGYDFTANFIEDLVAYQQKLRERSPLGSDIFLRPLLKDCKEKLNYLSKQVCVAEIHHRQQEFDEECQTLLHVAVYFAFISPDWSWLGEKLLLMVIKIAVQNKNIERRYEAIARFIYAKFLIETSKEYNEALEHLTKARILALNRGWKVTEYFPEINDTLYMITNSYIYETHMRTAQNLLNEERDLSKAWDLAEQARRRAAETCLKERETQALMLRGEIAMRMTRYKAAINAYRKALKIEELRESPEGICKVSMGLAKAYMMHNADIDVLVCLEMLERVARDNNLQFYQALAYKHLGEFYLNKGLPEKANPLMNEASEIFTKLYENETLSWEGKMEVKQETEMVHLMEALAAGLRLFPKYIELIVKFDEYDVAGLLNLTKLIAWKNRRSEFCEDFGKFKELKDLTSSYDFVKLESEMMVAEQRVSRVKSEIDRKKFIEKMVEKKFRAFAHILREASSLLDQSTLEDEKESEVESPS